NVVPVCAAVGGSMQQNLQKVLVASVIRNGPDPANFLVCPPHTAQVRESSGIRIDEFLGGPRIAAVHRLADFSVAVHQPALFFVEEPNVIGSGICDRRVRRHPFPIFCRAHWSVLPSTCRRLAIRELVPLGARGAAFGPRVTGTVWI